MTHAIVIPAKGGSKRVPQKNLLELRGKSLLQIAVEKAQSAADDVFVSSEDEDILAIGERLGAKTIQRPKSLSDHWYALMDWEINGYGLDLYSHVFHLHCTAPFLRKETILSFVDRLTTDKSLMSGFTATAAAPFYWTRIGPGYDIRTLPRSQEMEPVLLETHGMYGIKPIGFKVEGHRYPEPYYTRIVSQLEGFDIDTKEDYIAARSIVEHPAWYLG